LLADFADDDEIEEVEILPDASWKKREEEESKPKEPSSKRARTSDAHSADVKPYSNGFPQPTLPATQGNQSSRVTWNNSNDNTSNVFNATEIDLTLSSDDEDGGGFMNPSSFMQQNGDDTTLPDICTFSSTLWNDIGTSYPLPGTDSSNSIDQWGSSGANSSNRSPIPYHGNTNAYPNTMIPGYNGGLNTLASAVSSYSTNNQPGVHDNLVNTIVAPLWPNSHGVLAPDAQNGINFRNRFRSADAFPRIASNMGNAVSGQRPSLTPAYGNSNDPGQSINAGQDIIYLDDDSD